MRRVLQRAPSVLVLLLIMFIGSLVLWVGVPLAWLYVGSQVQAETNSIGAALGVMAAGVAVSLALLLPLLAWLNRKHVEMQAARGLDSYGQTALEAVVVVSAGCALTVFVVWFFFFSGSSPIPI